MMDNSRRFARKLYGSINCVQPNVIEGDNESGNICCNTEAVGSNTSNGSVEFTASPLCSSRQSDFKLSPSSSVRDVIAKSGGSLHRFSAEGLLGKISDGRLAMQASRTAFLSHKSPAATVGATRCTEPFFPKSIVAANVRVASERKAGKTTHHAYSMPKINAHPKIQRKTMAASSIARYDDSSGDEANLGNDADNVLEQSEVLAAWPEVRLDSDEEDRNADEYEEKFVLLKAGENYQRPSAKIDFDSDCTMDDGSEDPVPLKAEDVEAELLEDEVDADPVTLEGEVAADGGDQIVDDETQSSQPPVMLGYIGVSSNMADAGQESKPIFEMIEESAPVQYACGYPGCETFVDTDEALRTHVETEHLAGVDVRERRLVCHVCGKRFSNPQNMGRHQISHSAEKPFACDVCGKRYTSKQGVQKHQLKHFGQELSLPFACDVCEKKFAARATMEVHKLSHTGQKPHTCSVCGRGFVNRQNLQRHEIVHSENSQPFQCGLCANRFSTKQSLTMHLLRHTGDKPHACGVCGRAFADKRNLNKHMQIHAGGRKPYKCEVCQRTFSTKNNLREHTETHSRAPFPFQCATCDKRFKRRHDLRAHERYRHQSYVSEAPVKCSQCTDAFDSIDDLKKHILDRHNLSVETVREKR